MLLGFDSKTPVPGPARQGLRGCQAPTSACSLAPMAKARHPKRSRAHKVAPHAKARKGGKCPHCGKAHTKSEHWSHAARHGAKWYGAKERPQTKRAKSGKLYKKHPKTGKWEHVKEHHVKGHKAKNPGGRGKHQVAAHEVKAHKAHKPTRAHAVSRGLAGQLPKHKRSHYSKHRRAA